MGTGSELSIRVDPAQIQEAIAESVRIAIAKELGPQKDALVRAVVEAAITKPSGGYGKSPFATALDAIIRKEAEAAVKEIVEAEGPRIRAALKARITAEHLVDKILDSVLKARPLYVQVDIRDQSAEDDGTGG